MIINPDALRRDAMQLVSQINKQIKELQEAADELGIPLEKMRDHNGDWSITPLLLAKAQAYSTLALLQVSQRD